MKELPKHKKLILFDGVCNLCNASVLYVIKRDKKDLFRFATLQSDIGKQIVQQYNLDSAKTDSILHYSETNGLSSKSSAVLQVARHLGFPNNLMCIFFIIPPFIRNWVYDYIAKNRYKWYGKRKQCMVPTHLLKKKFLE
jgi:predicted DCC family thiol-disulfide oxidoreductase YuxK